MDLIAATRAEGGLVELPIYQTRTKKLGSPKILSQNKLYVNTTFLVQKNLDPRNLGSKKIWVRKIWGKKDFRLVTA